MKDFPDLVAFDLDGTLAASKQFVTTEMGKLLRALLEKVPVAVMSGGAFHQFQRQLLPSLPSDSRFERLYLFPTNAAAGYRFANGAWQNVYKSDLTDDERRLIRNAFAEALAQVGMAQEPQKLWGERLEDRGPQFTFSALGQFAPVEEKRTWHDGHPQAQRKLRDALASKLPEYSVSTGGLTSVDVTHRGITKSYGLRQLCALTNIPVAQMLYVGDALQEGGNDAVVKETEVQTRAVSGPEETAKVIEEILARL